MIRLSSYLIYPIIIIGFPLIVFGTLWVNFNYHNPSMYYTLFGGLFIIGWLIYLALKSRRVFYEDSILYIYSLFTARQDTVTRQNIIEFKEAYHGSNGRGGLFYLVSYRDNNGQTNTIRFLKNFMLADFDQYVIDMTT